MKNIIYLLISVVLTFLVPLLSSWLYSWSFISAWWPRWVLVILLMAIEVTLGAIVIWQICKNIAKNNLK